MYQMRSLDAQLYPEKLRVIAQQVQEQQAQTQSLIGLQQHEQLERDPTPACSPQVGPGGGGAMEYTMHCVFVGYDI